MQRNETIAALEAERQRLQGLIGRAKTKLAHIEALLAPDEEEQPEKAPQFVFGAKQNPFADIPAYSVQRTTAAGTIGLRGAIKQVLGTHPNGLKVREIVSLVPETGYKPGGKTSARNLVYGEVARMVKARHLVRRGGRKYSLPQELAQ
jgi:hypothetical protein